MTSNTARDLKIAQEDIQTRGRMLTVSQVARLLSVHPNSVRRWADLELLPSCRFGVRGDRRFRLDDIAEFFAAHKGGPPD